MNKSRELSETMEVEKESMILRLQEDIKELEILNERFEKHLQLQRDEIAKITTWLTTEIDSNKNLKLLSKERQDAIKILSHIFELLEYKAGDNDNALLCNTKLYHT